MPIQICKGDNKFSGLLDQVVLNMILSVHINSIDLGGSARAAGRTPLELWVSAEPTKGMGTTQPIKVDANSLLSINKDFKFELNPNLIREKNLISLKVSILKKRFIGSEHIADVEFNFLRLPQNQSHRSIVGMVAYHQNEQPQLDIAVNLTDAQANINPGPYQHTNLENFVKVAGIAANGVVVSSRSSASKIACETSIFADSV